MKVNGVFQANMIQTYNDAKKKIVQNQEPIKADSVTISPEARNLLSISNENLGESSAEKIEALRSQVAKGTYEVSPTLIAQRMLTIMKGSEV